MLKSNRYAIAIAVVLLCGFFLRIAHLGDNFQFAYDQARDALRILEITQGKLKLVGPDTDIRGIFNGPFFYYLLVIPNLVGGFNPRFVIIFMIFLNVLSSLLVYWFGYRLSNNKLIGLITLILWSVSNEQLTYARYISNASLMGPTTLAFFYLFYEYYRTKRLRWLIAASVAWGLAVQMNFYLIYLGIVYLFLLKRKSLVHLGLALLTCAAGISYLFIAELKWGFAGSKALITYFFEQKTFTTSIISRLSEAVNSYINRFEQTLSWNFDPLTGFHIAHWVIFLLVCIYFVYYIRDKKMVVVALLITFSNVFLFIFRSGVLTIPVINSTITAGLYFIFATVIAHLTTSPSLARKLIGFTLCSMIVFTNIIYAYQHNFQYNDMLGQDALKWAGITQSIDYIYQSSINTKDKISVCAVTNPMFINAGWSYGFKTYGEKKFGYIPNWIGQPQYLTTNYLSEHHPLSREVYLIIEPDHGFPAEAIAATLLDANQHTKLVEEKRFNGVTVQRRMIREVQEYQDKFGMSKENISKLINVLDIVPFYRCDYQLEASL